MKESDIQRAICDYLMYKKRFFWRVNNIPAFNKASDGRITMRKLPKYTPRGLPDVMVLQNGCFIGLEVKTDKGRQTPEQKEFGRLVTEHGGEYYVVRSIDDVTKLGL